MHRQRGTEIIVEFLCGCYVQNVGAIVADLKQRLAAVLASPEGKAMIEDGQQFSIEELQAAFAQVLAEADDHEGVVLEAAMNAVLARKVN